MRILLTTGILVALAVGAWAVSSGAQVNSADAETAAEGNRAGVPSYALREIRPGPLVPGTTKPTLLRARDATLRDWVPPE